MAQEKIQELKKSDEQELQIDRMLFYLLTWMFPLKEDTQILKAMPAVKKAIKKEVCQIDEDTYCG